MSVLGKMYFKSTLPFEINSFYVMSLIVVQCRYISELALLYVSRHISLQASKHFAFICVNLDKIYLFTLRRQLLQLNVNNVGDNPCCFRDYS